MLKLMVLLTLWLPVPKPQPVITPTPVFVNVPPATVQVNMTPSKKDALDYAIAICNIVLAGVGIGGILVAIGTLKTISRQTNSIEKSVQVAERALILQHRPRVIVRGGFVSDMDGVVGPRNAGAQRIDLLIVNKGDSNAHIFQGQISVVCGGTPLNPRIPNDALQSMTLKPGETQSLTRAIPEGANTAILMSETKHRGELKNDVFISSVFLVGWIKYRDEEGTERRTGLLRVYMPGLFKFVPPEANENEYAD